jgi:hypothetical protein
MNNKNHKIIVRTTIKLNLQIEIPLIHEIREAHQVCTGTLLEMEHTGVHIGNKEELQTIVKHQINK